MSLEYLVLLAVAGAAGGFLAGLLGIGGGVIYIFIFTEYFNQVDWFPAVTNPIPFIIAQAVFVIAVASLAGSLKQYHQKNFYFKESLLMGLPAAIVSIVVGYILNDIHYNETIFVSLFAALILSLLFRMLFFVNKKTEVQDFPKSGVTTTIGGFSGAIMALTGLGGGVVITPLLNGVWKVNIKKVGSVSLGVIFISSFSLTLYNLISTGEEFASNMVGYIHFPSVLPLALTVVFAAPLGVFASKRMPSKVLRIIFISLCAVVLIRLLYRVV